MRKQTAKKKDEWVAMLKKARALVERAYAPYSDLRVAAVLRGSKGTDYLGCNVENSSFGLTMCAERAAVACALAQGERTWTKLLIYTPDAGPLSPCGACRQVLAEFCRELPILSVGRGNLRREMNLRELLPQPYAWPAGNETADSE